MKFLNLEKEAFGLDISDRSVKMVNLKKKGKSFVLQSQNQIEMDPGIVEKGVICDEEALAKIIKSLYQNPRGKKPSTKYVVASLPEEKSFLEVIKMPPMAPKELALAMRFEAENYIPLPAKDVYLDFEVIQNAKTDRDHLDILIVATPKKIVNSYITCIKKAGLVPLALEVESQATARALVKKEEAADPMVFIDFGRTSAIFIIFAGHSIYFTSSIPVSSEQITSALAKSLGVKPLQADKLKNSYTIGRKKEDAKSKKIQDAIEPVLENLVGEIKKYLNFYQSHNFEKHLSGQEAIKKIILCGGGANLKGLPEFLSKKLELPVEVGDFWVNVTARKNDKILHKNSLGFITALGLALRGMNIDKNP